mmetsp:Transcript_6915/g.10270  ORF Transcript_6915/g.10270 Transcript_6915/m.10270 type:complete len:714 (-) Transcript_6915:161-2302(-)
MPSAASVSPPDPAEWLDLLERQQVTVWNTVPAFMELLVSHLEYAGLGLPASLRVVLLSGDWIPLNLPARIRRLCVRDDKEGSVGLRIISLGGATEASIWSNMFEVTSSPEDSSATAGIPTGWSSVPYGYPLRNQSMVVLNERMEHCEPWVTGAIYIGGVGVARGYHNDPVRSAQQFVRHPISGEMLFRTGDLGRVRPGGILEILGREDSQVKLNGYRIELGEIEKVLTDHPLVASATVAVHNRALCAYYVTTTSSHDTGIVPSKQLSASTPLDDSPEVSLASISSDLARRCELLLTDYMVPRHFMELDKIPLSPNGKVVRSKLPAPRLLLSNSDNDSASNAALVLPANETEVKVLRLFSEILGVRPEDICCEKSTFFEMGGNSLLSIQLIFLVRAEFNTHLGIQELFNAPTVVKLSRIVLEKSSGIDGKNPSKAAATKRKVSILQLQDGESSSAPLVLINPAGASGLCYMELVKAMGPGRRVLAVDDNVLSAGAAFDFQSLEQVAEECLLALREALQGTSPVQLLLGGWSYGGVVAVEMARQLAVLGEASPFQVMLLTLFDAPLRQPPVAVVPEVESDVDDSEVVNEGASKNNKSGLVALLTPIESSATSEGLPSLTKRIEQHFESCTSLLRVYQQRMPQSGTILCPLLDVRPLHTTYDCGSGAAEEVVSCKRNVWRHVVPGNHWTMLFGVNAPSVAEVVLDAINGVFDITHY